MEKTNRYDVRFCLKRDHLHIRGENLRYANRFFAGLGSPPHTWRKRWQTDDLAGRLRITSTYVEKTALLASSNFFIWDHLHIRGENIWRTYQLLKILGSPPHTWRKRHPCGLHLWRCGDHLHICGENFIEVRTCSLYKTRQTRFSSELWSLVKSARL